MLTAQTLLEETETSLEIGRSGRADGSHRRFTIAAIVGVAVVTLPYLYVLWDLWNGSPNPFRAVSPANFYDLQAQAIIHGHLSVSKGSLGIEGFIHDGRTYTYFGLLPSLLRIPILLVVPHAAGHLTAPSILLAWFLTGLFSSVLIWRVRILLRGSASLEMTEAVALSVLIASIMGGSILMFLASSPWVYDEDVAWSIPVTIATLFVFLGVLDRPTRGRVLAAALLVTAGVLGREPPALACLVGAVLIAGWFRFGRTEEQHRRWALPMLGAGIVPFLISIFVNWLKFGTVLNGLPLATQVWTRLSAHRRAFLASTGGNGYSFHFLPTTLWAYLQPFGLRIQTTFPFFTLPVHSPHVFGNYIVDVLYPTPSVPASMPLLFLLSCCALVVCFRRGASRAAILMRIPLLAAAAGTAVDFLLGYIAPRYLGDFLPFLVLGGAIGLITVWGRLQDRGPRFTRLAMVVVILLGLLSVAINIGIALTPTPQWSPAQTSNYVKTVKSISDVTGHPLASQIRQVSSLPYWAPAGDIYIIGDCTGAYLSTGENFSYAPGLQIQHDNWDVIEQGPGIVHKIEVTFNQPVQPGPTVPILTYGDATLVVEPLLHERVLFKVEDPDAPHIPWPPATSPVVAIAPHKTYTILVWTDPNLNRIVVWWEGTRGEVITRSGTYLPSRGTAVVQQTDPERGGVIPPMTVTDATAAPSNVGFCRSLLEEVKR
jgi:hypothetical protein